MSARWGWTALVFATLFYVAAFLAFYPPIHSTEDEVGFINQALVLSRGAVSAEGAGFGTLPDFIEVHGRHVGWRNPGITLPMAALMWLGGYHAVFLCGLGVHVLLVVVSGCVLRQCGLSPAWAVLVLFHPTLALYSRTAMADEAAGLFLLLAFYALIRDKPGVLAGIAAGLATLMRYHVFLVVPALSYELWRRGRDARGFALASCSVGALGLAWNWAVYGSWFSPAVPGYFDARAVLPHLAFYGAALLCIWPLSLLALGARTPVRPWVLATVLPLLALFVPYYFHDQGESPLATLVMGQRLIQPILPEICIQYALVLAPLTTRWRRARPVAAAGLAAAVLALFHSHQAHLRQLVADRTVIESMVPPGSAMVCNATAAKLLGVPERGRLPYAMTVLYQDRLVNTPQLPPHFYLVLLVRLGPVESAAQNVEGSCPAYDFVPIPGPDVNVRIYDAKRRS